MQENKDQEKLWIWACFMQLLPTHLLCLYLRNVLHVYSKD